MDLDLADDLHAIGDVASFDGHVDRANRAARANAAIRGEVDARPGVDLRDHGRVDRVCIHGAVTAEIGTCDAVVPIRGVDELENRWAREAHGEDLRRARAGRIGHGDGDLPIAGSVGTTLRRRGLAISVTVVPTTPPGDGSSGPPFRAPATSRDQRRQGLAELIRGQAVPERWRRRDGVGVGSLVRRRGGARDTCSRPCSH